MFFDVMMRETYSSLFSFFDPQSRIYVLYLLTSVVLAFIAFWQIEKVEAREHGGEAAAARPSFFQYLFDPKIWLHPSSLQDFQFFVVNSLIYYGVIAQAMISSHTLTLGFHGALIGAFGPIGDPVAASWIALAAYTLVAVLAFDLAAFLMHYAMHKVPFLWHFHKVHHSAEVLTPVTLFRMHPLELFLTSVLAALFIGLGMGGVFYITGQPPQELTIYGLNILLFVFYLAGYNLRHSHVWLNYPYWLSHVLVSPAQHQVHHSSDPKHFDMNMGLMFAFWDKLFGTLYVPRGREELKFGIDGAQPNPFKSVWDIYWKPFVWAGETLRQSIPDVLHRRLIYCGLAIAALGYGYAVIAVRTPAAPAASQVASVKLEKLTWLDTHAALKAGYDTIIIPTGGTEQNGPFVALGKHNVIVERTTHAIAQKLGKTLVAPVMAYVPEGDPARKEGHMAFPGTLSLPEPVFEAVLAATAQSLKTHGFKTILLIGDSGDSQAAQERVAARLSQSWAADGVRVLHIGDYYAANRQVAMLKAKGLSENEIGWHAGIRDTSELMALAPDQVRIKPFELPAGMGSGANGAVAKANAEIGRQMLALKIEAAVRQVHRLRGVQDEPARKIAAR